MTKFNEYMEIYKLILLLLFSVLMGRKIMKILNIDLEKKKGKIEGNIKHVTKNLNGELHLQGRI